MPPFDYNAPAELFLAKRTKSSRENYRRFATAAEALRYAVGLADAQAFGAWLEVGDERFNSNEIQRLYEADIRCGSLSDRHSLQFATGLNGLHVSPRPPPGFQNSEQAAIAIASRVSEPTEREPHNLRTLARSALSSCTSP